MVVRWVVVVVVGCCCGGEVDGMGLWIGMVEVWVCGSVWWRFDLAVCRLAVEYALGRLAAVGFCVLEVVVCGVCIDGGVYWWWGLGLLGFFFVVTGGVCVVVGWWVDARGGCGVCIGGGDYGVARRCVWW